ncbi:MAG: uroporphyrinogen-III synthase [Pyrinomonadaceae bacterium]
MINVLLSPTDAQGDLAKALHDKGARIVTWPELRIGPLESFEPLDEAIEHLFGYDWIILKNVSAAEFFLRRFHELNCNVETLDDLRVCAVGDATAERLQESHVHVDLQLDRFANEGVFAAIATYLGGNDFIAGLNILVPCANVTHEVFEELLASQGARVDVVAAYRTTDETQRLAQVKGLLVGGGIDWVYFGQPSSIEEVARVFDTDDLPGLVAEASVACLDQETKSVATQFGLASAVALHDPSVDALTNLITTSSGSG